MKDRAEDPVWKERLRVLEADVHRAIDAVLAHTGNVAAMSLPLDLPDGNKRAVVVGDPIALFATITGEGPKLLLNKHMIVTVGSPGELLAAMLMGALKGTMAGALSDDEEECDCARCVAQRANPN